VLWGGAQEGFTPGGLLKAGTNPHGLAVGDFDSDGFLDLAVGTRTSQDVSVYLGDGKGSFRLGSVFRVPDDVISLAAGDMDGDGKLDLVLAFASRHEVGIYLGDGKGRFAPADTPSNGRR